MDIIGTPGADTLTGGIKDDLLKGLGGDDWLLGGGGDDTVLGGAGVDHLEGGDGDDMLNGGAGADYLVYGGQGNDTVLGGAGDDLIIGADATVTRSILLNGGDGDDLIYLNDQSLLANFTVKGGAGGDNIEAEHANSGLIDAGAGDDFVYAQAGFYKISLGDGHDQLKLNGQVNAEVLDFSTSAESSDSLELSDFLILRLSGWDQHSNPFAGGYVRFDQRGADAVLQVDANGGGDSWTDTVRFDNLDASQLLAAQIDGYHLSGNGISSYHVNGTAGNETLSGGAGDDLVKGKGGDDLLWGQLGDDTLVGGVGDDQLNDDSGGSMKALGGAGDDSIIVTRSVFETGVESF